VGENKSNVTIRPATREDIAFLVHGNASMALETEDKHLDRALLTRGVEAVFAEPRRGFYLIAELDGQRAGCLLITYEWSDWRNGWFWWIQSVYVHERARRSGVFRSLYRAIEAQAAADPTVIGLRLYFERDNTRAQATYRALGMSDTAYGMMEVYPLDGRAAHIE